MEQKIIAVVAGREIKESDFEKFLQNVPCLLYTSDAADE